MTLVNKIRNLLKQMPPHQRERLTAQLLAEAAKELEELKAKLAQAQADGDAK